MYLSNPNKLAFAVFLACQSLAASATTITVSQGLALNQLYDSNTYSSTFDAAAALGTSDFSADYQLNSALVHFDWTDNSDDAYFYAGTTNLNTVYGGYYYSSYNGGNYIYRRSATGGWSEQYRTPTEQAIIYFDSQWAGFADTSHSSTTSSVSTNSTYSTYDGGYGGYWSYSYYCYWGCYSYSYWVNGSQYYTDHTDTITKNYDDRTGSFSRDFDLLALGGTALDNFLLTGTLPFSMTMNGNAFLTAATLELDVTRKVHAIPVADTSAVPEPATIALLALGLTGLGWSRRSRPASR